METGIDIVGYNISISAMAKSRLVPRDDLIQEAVKSMWEKSGLLKESKKYNINYQYYFVARNYMNSYLTKWKREMEYNRIIEDLVDAIKINGKRFYHPMFGWVHC